MSLSCWMGSVAAAAYAMGQQKAVAVYRVFIACAQAACPA